MRAHRTAAVEELKQQTTKYYLGFRQPRMLTLSVPGGTQYTVDVIDTWNMTVDHHPEPRTSTFAVDLPARPYIAVRLTRVARRAAAPSASAQPA